MLRLNRPSDVVGGPVLLFDVSGSLGCFALGLTSVTQLTKA